MSVEIKEIEQGGGLNALTRASHRRRSEITCAVRSLVSRCCRRCAGVARPIGTHRSFYQHRCLASHALALYHFAARYLHASRLKVVVPMQPTSTNSKFRARPRRH